ncbi:HK97-gp10 family putative phage morphogenesis protein [Actinomadura sp. NPDC049382]|uniref:HK97-gp10 family putative phage morphogenesis protein n=1 Tax=Actinomadura sp. NPDC049382 TaxID=3158220 RepID=UPI0034244158
MTERVTIEGLDELHRRLEEVGEQIREAAGKAIKDSAEAVRDDAREQVRVDTGRMKRGLKAFVKKADLSAEVGWRDPDLYYAKFHEFGTTRIPANPALTAAAEAERSRLPDRITEDVRRAIGR